MRSQPDQEKYGIRAVERALYILLCFGSNDQEITIDDIVRRSRLHKSTAYRLLATLQASKFVERNPDNHGYRLGSAVLLLGTIALGQLGLRRVAHPHLEQLMQQTGETVHLSVLNEESALCIDKVDSFRSVRMASYVGFRDPLHCTGVGKVLLAYQPAQEIDRLLAAKGLRRYTESTITAPEEIKRQLAVIREQGYALDMEEIESGLRCIAAPIRDYSDRVIASISISGPSSRITDELIPQLRTAVLDVAARISREMGQRSANS